MSEVEDALKGYYQALVTSDLSLTSQSTYLDMANNFVRWMRYEFEPGTRTYFAKKVKDKPCPPTL